MHYENANNFYILIFHNLPNSIFILLVFALESLTCIFNLTKLKFNKYLYFIPDLHAIFVQHISPNWIFTSTKYLQGCGSTSCPHLHCLSAHYSCGRPWPSSWCQASSFSRTSSWLPVVRGCGVSTRSLYQFPQVLILRLFLRLFLYSLDAGYCVPYLLKKGEFCYHLLNFFHTLADFYICQVVLLVTKRDVLKFLSEFTNFVYLKKILPINIFCILRLCY